MPAWRSWGTGTTLDYNNRVKVGTPCGSNTASPASRGSRRGDERDRSGRQARRRPLRPGPAGQPRPGRRGRVARAHRHRPVALRQPPAGFRRGRRRRQDDRRRAPRRRPDRVTNLRVGGEITVRRWHAGPSSGGRDRRRLGAVHPDRGRSHRCADAPAGAPGAVRAVPLAGGVEHARVDDLADGRSEHRLIGASTFPRHWVYDSSGTLVAKTGLIDRKDWASTRVRQAHAVGRGGLAGVRHRGRDGARARAGQPGHARRGAAKDPQGRTGDVLTRQGDAGDELFLLLDGVLVVDVDGTEWAEVGPGAVLGERALLEGGRRTSTLLARTPCRVAAVPAEQIDREQLAELAVAIGGRCPTMLTTQRAARRALMRIHLDGVGGPTPAPGDEIDPCERSHVMRVVVQRLGRALKLPPSRPGRSWWLRHALRSSGLFVLSSGSGDGLPPRSESPQSWSFTIPDCVPGEAASWPSNGGGGGISCATARSSLASWVPNTLVACFESGGGLTGGGSDETSARPIGAANAPELVYSGGGCAMLAGALGSASRFQMSNAALSWSTVAVESVPTVDATKQRCSHDRRRCRRCDLAASTATRSRSALASPGDQTRSCSQN